MSTRAPLDHFETALLAELRREVATRATVPSSRSRRRAATLAGVGSAAAATIVCALVLRPEAAFAVQRESDGDVVVTIKSLDDADGLERALAAEGVEAEVTYDGSAAVPSDLDPGDAPASPQLDTQESSGDEQGLTPEPAQGSGDCSPNGVLVELADDGAVTFTLDAVTVDSDARLRLTTAGSAADWMAVSVQWVGETC